MLTLDIAHKPVFTNVPIIGFKNHRSLKDHLVWAVLPKVDAVCTSVNDTSHFKKRDTNETFNILQGPLDFNSNHVIYLNVSNVNIVFFM